MNKFFSDTDLKYLKQKGIRLEDVDNQIENFKKGISFLSLKSHASVGKGILKLSNDDILKLKNAYDRESDKLSILKFVPASGAASRMFKPVFEYTNNSEKAVPDGLLPFFDGLTRFAFYNELNIVCKKLYDKSVEKLLAENEHKKIAKAVLDTDGLNYGNSPKALLSFHWYEGKSRTSLEEHLVEGALYAKSQNNKVYLHFTVSPEHMDAFKLKVKQTLPVYSKEFGVEYDISYSTQKSSTDTIAVDMSNNPFRTNSGNLLFRPGGHGALLDNLNAINADIIYIKNIDNVVPDKLKGETITYKKALAGKLLEIKKKLFEFASMLDNEATVNNDFIEQIEVFYKKIMFFQFPQEYSNWEVNRKIEYLKLKVNRPIRICGMVKNEGEPGGGPFIAYNSDGSASLQVVETSQINTKDKEQNNHLANATHFNPVDLICSTKNYKGEKYNLFDFRDANTGFISKKSSEGRELKALELPGLWNGAMSDWNTLFVEVPIITFNPVKTILDLLRKEHQN